MILSASKAKYEVGLEKFLSTNGIGAFADTFQDLHGLKQLPGIAAQNLMGKGIGFGPEGITRFPLCLQS